MYIKFCFGNGEIISSKIIALDCPNEFKGIGDITVQSEEGLWTGDVHVYSSDDKYTFHFGSITKVQITKNIIEDDGEWKTIWKASAQFKYKNFFELVKILKKKRSVWKKNE
jgi:hypothetical protein